MEYKSLLAFSLIPRRLREYGRRESIDNVRAREQEARQTNGTGCACIVKGGSRI